MERKKYVDVNVFVYWLGGDKQFGKRAHMWVKRMEERDGFVTSSLTLYELLTIFAGIAKKSLRDPGFTIAILRAIMGLRGLEVIGLDSEDYIKALTYMETYKLDFEDALHLAAAIKAEAQEIITNDSHFEGLPIKRSF